jgi:hypothetical protein
MKTELINKVFVRLLEKLNEAKKKKVRLSDAQRRVIFDQEDLRKKNKVKMDMQKKLDAKHNTNYATYGMENDPRQNSSTEYEGLSLRERLDALLEAHPEHGGKASPAAMRTSFEDNPHMKPNAKQKAFMRTRWQKIKDAAKRLVGRGGDQKDES